MSKEEKLTEIDGPMLAAAFPAPHHQASILAGQEAARLLAPIQWTGRFAVKVEGETVFIPARLHFTSDELTMLETEEAWRFVRALQTRSSNGFERQRAARDLLKNAESWSAPFIVALIGEYIVEILEDVFDALTPKLEQTLAAFIVGNEAFWFTTKRRIVSYWDAYYRYSRANELGRAFQYNEYVGFKLADRLEVTAFGSRRPTNK